MNSFNLYVRKRTLPEWLALFVFAMPFLLSFLQDFLHFPSLVKYTVDVAWVGGLWFLVARHQQKIHRKLFPFVCFVVVFFVYVLFFYILNFQSVFYFLWGFRNNFRYYAAFFAFVFFLKKDDVSLCWKYIDVLFAFHVIVTFVQFFFLGYKWDYLGGIFGVQLGCNSYSMILLIVVCSKSLLSYMNGEEKIWMCILKNGFSLVIASLAELKFYFVLFLFITIFSACITKFSWRKILILICSAFIAYFAGNLFVAVWGEESRLSIERIFELVTAQNYASSEDLGRITALPTISETILTDFGSKCFGLGLGNCDTSTFAICNTPFHQVHGYLNYDWLSSAFLFLETGYVGIAMYISFLIIVFISVLRLKKRNTGNLLACQMSMMMCLISVALLFYNSSLRSETGYIVYFILALPFIDNSWQDSAKTEEMSHALDK